MKSFRPLLLALLAAATACAPRERTLVVLSTNDMHAKILQFPRLASAVEACRDTAELVLLVDAGDRWTGNAYVDKTSAPGKPVIELMNRLGYDAATLGNHEFDHGQAYLGRMLDSMDFPVVCANVASDTCTFPQLPASVVLERGGLRIGIVGAVTNYEGPGHPAGHKSSFTGLRFPDPQQEAIRLAGELRPRVDVLLLLSHMGDDRDAELLARESRYDLLVGGHTHVELDTLVGGTPLTQTGKDLANVGVTTLRLRGRRVVGADFELRPLAAYAPDPAFAAQVEGYYADERLNAPVGHFGAPADKTGLGNWMAAAIARRSGAAIGVYHVGGVRLDSIPAGGVGIARVYDLEPFGTRIARLRMTPEQLGRMVAAKYNEPTREGHRLDLVMTVPYTISTDGADSAVRVAFPTLREGEPCEVAMSDYIFRNYPGLEYDRGRVTDTLVTDALFGELGGGAPLLPDNTPRSQVVRFPEELFGE